MPTAKIVLQSPDSIMFHNLSLFPTHSKTGFFSPSSILLPPFLTVTGESLLIPLGISGIAAREEKDRWKTVVESRAPWPNIRPIMATAGWDK